MVRYRKKKGRSMKRRKGGRRDQLFPTTSYSSRSIQAQTSSTQSKGKEHKKKKKKTPQFPYRYITSPFSNSELFVVEYDTAELVKEAEICYSAHRYQRGEGTNFSREPLVVCDNTTLHLPLLTIAILGR